MIDEDIRDVVEAELREDEELLWTGRPRKALDTAFLATFLLVILMLIWLIYSDLSLTEPLRNLVGHWPFLLPAFLLIIIVVDVRRWYLASERYAITNQTVFILSDIPTRTLQTIPFNNLKKVVRSRLWRRNTINLTVDGKPALNSKTSVSQVTLGFWNRAVVQLKYLSNAQIPLDILQSKNLEILTHE